MASSAGSSNSTLNLILLIEGLVGVAAQGITALKNAISSGSSETTDQVLDDADATYATVIANAQAVLAQHSTPPAPTS